MRMIDRFDGKYRFLSNFYMCEVDVYGIYPSAEHAYQACKCVLAIDRMEIRHASTPGQAKRMGRKVRRIHSNWDEIKRGVMEDIVRRKFTQNPELGAMLMDTDDDMIKEGNYWHDNYWGDCSCSRCRTEGLNVLGRILMDVRNDLRAGRIGGK